MIEQLSNFPDNVLAFVCAGDVTKAHYDTVVVPAVESALKKPGKLRIYYETSGDAVSISPGAVWEDFKLGVEHLTRWERVAVVTDIEWIKQSMRLFSFLIPGMARIFPSSQAAEAREWIIAAK